MGYRAQCGTVASVYRCWRSFRGVEKSYLSLANEICPVVLFDELGICWWLSLGLENEKAPDMSTFLRLCDWLQVPPAQLLLDREGPAAAAAPDTSEQIELLLRSDSKLDPSTANTLAAIIKATYQTLPKQPDKRDG